VKENTVQEQVEQFLRYLRGEENYADNTIAAYRNDLGQFLAFATESAASSVDSWMEVDQDLIQAYGAYLDQQGYASSTVARKIASVKSFFSFLVDLELLTENPTVVLNAPKVEKRPPRILSVEEIQTLLAEPAKARTPKGLRDRALLELLYATGMRVSELIMLHVSDVDMTAPKVTCTGRDGKERQLPLTPRAAESLVVYLEKGRKALVDDGGESRLFLNQRGRPLTRQGLWLITKSYAESAGLGSDVTPHTMRHSCAAHRVAQGADLHKIRDLLGHANVSTTQVYVDMMDSDTAGSETDLSQSDQTE
jgi:integrase/recombinase XerD